MVYTLCMLTVKQLSDLAGITRRTLHYYDEIDLLKPTETCSNGYRYYGEDAILRLQQILLYRQLGLSLDMIRKILNNPSFDVIAALQNHKKELKKRVDQLQRLEKTVDDTILYIEGKKQMSQKQLFKAFSEEEQAKYEEEANQLWLLPGHFRKMPDLDDAAARTTYNGDTRAVFRQTGDRTYLIADYCILNSYFRSIFSFHKSQKS